MGRVVIPGFRKIEVSGGGEGGTSNYNDLTNKPSINNVPLVGNLKTVDLKLTDATLTEEGIPAESKTVGQKLKEQSSNLTSEISRAKETEEVLKSRIDNIASLPEGSTTGNAELLDIRVKANGTTATSAGNAVREQVSELKGDFDNLPIELNCQYLKLSDLDAGKYYNWYSDSPSMSIIAHDAYSIYKTPIPVKSGQTINYKNIDMAFTVVTTIDNKLIGKMNNLTGKTYGTGMYTV